MADRDRDRRPYERDRFGGDAYRPRDDYRGRGPPLADTYVPIRGNARARSPPYRRRSRSPRDNRENFRSGGAWRPGDRERPRSPPRRAFSPRRDDDRRDFRARSPPRYRSPRRDRELTPLPIKRTREPSPIDRNRDRSPPPKRERLASPPPKRERLPSPAPRGRYPRYEPDLSFHHARPLTVSSPRRGFSPRREVPRPRSPRRDRRDVSDLLPRRSPSPQRPALIESTTTSRRSSPPVHPSRAAIIPSIASPRPPLEPRGTPRHSPAPQRRPDNFDRRPDNFDRRPDNFDRERERERERDVEPPSGPAPRNGDGMRRPLPSGPRNFTSPLPPAGSPSGPAMSAHMRSGGHNSMLSAPSRPRRGGFGGYPQAPYSAPQRRTSEVHLRPSHGPPSGPRGPGPHLQQGHGFRGSNNSTSTTYPRTQRFLNDLPAVVPGGRKMAVKSNVNFGKLKKLEEESERLRQAIAEKEAENRAALDEWDRMERESDAAQLRTDLAEENLARVEML
ncbi:hypothetical protein EJ06DRAFT_566912 [Trichodelitschia bisporula]|uniref:Uncharacterized protein n=1 Tax=Trichodelitschia bisporula TaxID=703511 RepID=A0A6G1HMD8_9PEZI|nr:hypothetical protein EJ06DRAFT_566912 [Trichodelitschia bisporula]